MSPLEIFRNTADPFVWLCLGISLPATSILVKASCSKNFSWGSVLLATLSALICPGTAGLPGHSKLFQLWMFASVIFVTDYSGCLTSAVTSPSPEKRLENVADLWEANYSLIFVTQQQRNHTIQVLNEYVNWESKQNNFEVVKKFQQFAELIQNSVAYSINTFTNFSWHEKLRRAEHVAFFGHFGHVMQQATILTKLLRKRNNTKIGCFVGKKLELKEVMYWLIMRDGEGRLAKILERVIASGLYFRHVLEDSQLVQFSRVQDRSRRITFCQECQNG